MDENVFAIPMANISEILTGSFGVEKASIILRVVTVATNEIISAFPIKEPQFTFCKKGKKKCGNPDGISPTIATL